MGKTFVLFAKLLQNKKNLRQNKADCVWRDICGLGTVFLSREKRKWEIISELIRPQPRDWQKIKIGSGHKSLLSCGEIRIEFWIFFWLVRVIIVVIAQNLWILSYPNGKPLGKRNKMIRNRDRGQQTGFAYEFSPILILALFKTDFSLARVRLSTHWFSCLQKMSLESKFREKKVWLKG